MAELGVAGGQGAPRAQRLEVVELEAEAAEVQLHVLRERGVAGRQDEPVAPEPVDVGRVVAHDLLEEQVRGRREAHRRSGVAVADLLHGVGGKKSRGVDCLAINGIPVESCHDD